MILTDNTQRLLRLEAKVDAILGHLGVDFDPDKQIGELARNGEKFAAIRLHRSCLGSSLAEAKKHVEEMMSTT
jgi:hypothetical protein